MDEMTAREIIKVSIRAMALFDQLVGTLQTSLSAEEYEIQKRRIAGVMGEISFELLQPITKEYASLDPVKSREAWTAAGRLFEPIWWSAPQGEHPKRVDEVVSEGRSGSARSANSDALMKMSDQDLDTYLLSHIVKERRKIMRVIASVFQNDLNYKSQSILLYGFGSDDPDAFLDRCISRLRHMVSIGQLEAFGDISQPRFSEVRLCVGGA
jgi:hypothetical protein